MTWKLTSGLTFEREQACLNLICIEWDMKQILKLEEKLAKFFNQKIKENL